MMFFPKDGSTVLRGRHDPRPVTVEARQVMNAGPWPCKVGPYDVS